MQDNFSLTLVFTMLCTVLFSCFSGTPCPPFKIVILDEADSMTTHAQVRKKHDMFT